MMHQDIYLTDITEPKIEHPNESLQQSMQLDGIDNYGYDEFGKEINSDDIFGPRGPINASISLENIYNNNSFTLQAGARIDYFNSDNYKFTYTDSWWYDYNRGNDLLPYFTKLMMIFILVRA